MKKLVFMDKNPLCFQMTAASVKALNKGFGVSSLYQVVDILSSGYLAKEKKKTKIWGNV